MCELQFFAFILWFIVGCPVHLNFTYVPLVNGCYHVVLDKLYWFRANERCISLYPKAHLVIINSHAEQNVLSDLLYKQNSKQLDFISFVIVLSLRCLSSSTLCLKNVPLCYLP